MKANRSYRIVRAAAWLAIPAVVIASIWFPVVAHYRVPDAEIGMFTIEEARSFPPDPVLRELKGDRLLSHGWTKDQQLTSAAADLLRGELRIRGYAPIKFQLPFHPGNLTPASSWLQLLVAGLVPVDLLLQAHELTGQDEFFLAARVLILRFAEYERNAWLPRGLLWNDHAAANRIFVLSDFWRVYRHRPDFEPEAARTILRLVARSGQFLASPQHFTFASNHGVMQDIALLRLRLSFPSLPNAEYFRHLAIERLGEQLAFYVSRDGVVLEHSAGYQFFGIRLLEMAFRYMHLLDLPVPREWKARYERAREFASQLRRPDGSLPLFGDTSLGARTPVLPGPPKWSVAWYPVAGYAVWWDGLERWPHSSDLRQTVVAFSYFPGHAHKLADDLSVILWAGGQTWWTNLGYWPYDRRERSWAESWNGSNAPHLIDEPKDSERTSRMLSYGGSEKTAVLDVARVGPGTFAVRRQVIHLRPNTWFILDYVSGAPNRRSITRWTTDRGVILREGRTEGHYQLETQTGAAGLFAVFFGSPRMTLRTLPESLGPYSPGGKEQTVSAVEVAQQGGDSWGAVAWVFNEDRTIATPLGTETKMISWHDAEHWSLLLGSKPTPLEVGRMGNRVIVKRDGRLMDAVLLATASADLTSQHEEIRQAFLTAARKYPQFHARTRYRQWSTYALIALVVVQELSLLSFALRSPRVHTRLRLVTMLLWIVGGIYLSVVLNSS